MQRDLGEDENVDVDDLHNNDRVTAVPNLDKEFTTTASPFVVAFFCVNLSNVPNVRLGLRSIRYRGLLLSGPHSIRFYFSFFFLATFTFQLNSSEVLPSGIF